MEKLKLSEIMDMGQTYGVNLDKAIIYLAAEIGPALNMELRMRVDLIKIYWGEILKKTLKKITLFLSSPGGDASVILAFKDFFDGLEKEGILVDVHVEGICYSAATMLVALASGKRTATPNSRFMVHELQIQGVGGTATQTKSTSKEIEFLVDRLADLYADLSLRGKKTKAEKIKMHKTWDGYMAAETYLSSDEAKDLGLIDEIVLK